MAPHRVRSATPCRSQSFCTSLLPLCLSRGKGSLAQTRWCPTGRPSRLLLHDRLLLRSSGLLQHNLGYQLYSRVVSDGDWRLLSKQQISQFRRELLQFTIQSLPGLAQNRKAKRSSVELTESALHCHIPGGDSNSFPQ